MKKQKILIFSVLALILFMSINIGYGQITAWQFGSPASSGNEATYNATTNDANLNISTLSRGAGITATALGRGFAANGWDNGATKSSAITNGEYYQFTINAKNNYKVSLSTLDLTLRRSGATAPNAYIWKYSIDGTNFFEIGTDISFTSTADGVAQTQINLSGISDLQDVSYSTTITFRLYAWGGTSATATFSVARYATGVTTNCLAIGGIVSLISSPTINAPSSMTTFFTTVGTPSAQQSYFVSGTNLTAGIVITSPANFEISTNGGANFISSSPITLPSTGISTEIFVRYNPSANGNHSGNISHTSTGATTVNVPVSGSTPAPTISVTSSMVPFSTTVNNQSSQQSYIVSGANLTADIIITPASYLEISTTSGSGFSTTPITLPQSGGTVNPTTIYVVYNPTASGTYARVINNSSTGATTQTISVVGTTIQNHLVLLTEDFNYANGTLLTANGWAAHSGTTNNIAVTNPSTISYPGYVSSGIGGQTSITTSGEDVNKMFSTQYSGSIYCSFIVNVTSVSTTGDYFIHFGDSTMTSNFYCRVFVKKDASNKIAFGITKSTTSTSGVVINYTGFDYDLSTTYLIVFKYIFIDEAPNNDEADLFIFSGSTLPTTETSPTVRCYTEILNTDPTKIGSIAIRQGTNSPALIIDGIRIGTSWDDVPLPVNLQSFTGNVIDNNVKLNWKTETELNNSGFDIERKTNAGNWLKVGNVKGMGNSNTPQSYNYEDEKLQTGKYSYRLKQIDFNGNYEYFNLQNEITINAPKRFSIEQNYPNPFNPTTKISYTLPADMKIEIKIYNLLGQEILTERKNETVGYHTFEFNGTNFASGIYFYKITAGENSQIRKMILLR